MCNTCHLDGTESLADKTARTIAPADAGNKAPLFTDFTSSNLGIPKNPALPFYNETTADRYGYAPNPSGSAFVDKGVGGFLADRQNVNKTIGRLGLTSEQEDQLVAFLKTLTDGHQPQGAK